MNFASNFYNNAIIQSAFVILAGELIYLFISLPHVVIYYMLRIKSEESRAVGFTTVIRNCALPLFEVTKYFCTKIRR